MSTAKKLDWTIEELSQYVSEIITKESGNILEENQQSMVNSRLKKRMLDLNIKSPSEYYQFFQDNYNSEFKELVSLLTTHHTFFFREFNHFDFIINHIDEIVEKVKLRGDKKIKILSAACSFGQEAYSLAMLFKSLESRMQGLDYEIVGTDISYECISVAKKAVYPYKDVKSIAQIYLSGNWQRGKGELQDFARVKPHLTSKCHFLEMNLVTPPKVLSGYKFDIIFCRNVFIYFEENTIAEILKNFESIAHKNSLLFTGISESIKSYNLNKKDLAPSVYQINYDESMSLSLEKNTPALSKNLIDNEVGKKIKSSIPSPIRMLLVDDSPVVIKLLTKIFSTEGFEVVGTASNGIEAQEFLKSNTVDAMTLDIHMPEMDGVNYLKKNFRPGHPKVIVISSASREDARYAQETLRNGASDFVEKPSLNNIQKRSEEIQNKVRMSFLSTTPLVSSLDKNFKRDFCIQNPDTKSRVIFASYTHLKCLEVFLSELQGDQPPIIIFFEGNENLLDVTKDNLKTSFSKDVISSSLSKAKKNTVYFADIDKNFDFLKDQSFSAVSVSVFGICSENIFSKISEIKNASILLEEGIKENQAYYDAVSDVFPWTSFSHLGTEFLAKKD